LLDGFPLQLITRYLDMYDKGQTQLWSYQIQWRFLK
jgi:hypothetical protein